MGQAQSSDSDSVNPKGADNLTPYSRQYYERSIFKGVAALVFFGIALFALGQVSQSTCPFYERIITCSTLLRFLLNIVLILLIKDP